VIDARLLAELANAAGLTEPSIVVEELAAPSATRIAAALNPQRPHYPASMIKVPLAAALAVRCAAGELEFGRRVRVDAANLTANDTASAFVEGYEASLAECAHAMLSASDNVATNVLIDVVGRDVATEACAALGLTATAVRRKLSGAEPLIVDPAATGRNAHPAADAAKLFGLIARSRCEGGRFIRNALESQVWNDKLSRGLEPGDRFAHKTGDTDRVSHDGGLLTLANGRCFILVVYTALPTSPASDARFAAFSRALRPYLEGPVTGPSNR
jgi:beta-lactamase class A